MAKTEDKSAAPLLPELEITAKHLDRKGQLIVFFAAWLGWGLDVFDSQLFNFVAFNCIPTLLDLTIGSEEAQSETRFWTGITSSLLLVGWAIGGIAFGYLADIWGRKATMQITILLFAISTTLCAFSLNIWMLLTFRFLAALGIGGEWAAGALLVAESVPENRRVIGGVLLFTSSPFGLLLATFVNYIISGVILEDYPQYSWRVVFLFGLLPALVASLVRYFVEEPEKWVASRSESKDDHETSKTTEVKKPSLFVLLSKYKRETFSGLIPAVIATLVWWCVTAFAAIIASELAQKEDPDSTEFWSFITTGSFNTGSLFGVLCTFPVAVYLGRKPLYFIYFLGSSLTIIISFVFFIDKYPPYSLLLYFPIGFFVSGIFGSFTFYLPELFPTYLRGVGSGFCYNSGRFIAALGPFAVGYMTSNSISDSIDIMFWVGFLPLIGSLAALFIIETKNRFLQD